MQITHTVKTKFLVFPVNSFLPKKELMFFEDGKQIFELRLALDNISPTFLANVNTERFIGKEITFKTLPDMEIRFTESNEPMYMPEDGLIRPKLRHTARYGWTNDPNGLYKYGGEYHLYYQHNPCDITWGNMHWGHASSTDLVHWTELDEAFYPNEHGTAFSGCAYVDKENASGLKSGSDAPIFLYYTAAPRTDCKTSISYNKKWTQRIYVSLDGGKSFSERDEYIDELCPGNRDPRIDFSPELGKYVMALYLQNENYAILTSDDLIRWEKLQEMRLEGDNECPNFSRFKTEGTDEYKWVLYGAHSRYAVYEVRNGQFSQVQEPRSPLYSTAAYAGQDFRDPDTGRRIRIDWIRVSSNYCVRYANFSQIFGIPVELSLVKTEDGYYLTERPADEILGLCDGTTEIKGAKSGDSIEISDSAFIVKFDAKYIPGKKTVIKVKGRDIELDTAKNVMTCGSYSAPVSSGRERIDITVVADTVSLEIFADGGKFYTASVLTEDRNINSVGISGDGISDATLTLMKLKI